MMTNASSLCYLFSEFPKKTKMKGQQNLIITILPMDVIYNFPHVHTLPEELAEPWGAALRAPLGTADGLIGVLLCLFRMLSSSGVVGRGAPTPRGHWFPSHLVWYRPCIANRNKRQPSQYGGHWNHIQDLR